MALMQLDDLLAPKKAPISGVMVTPAALDRIKSMIATRPDLEGKGLRVYVTNGGCAGYSYGMAYDEVQDEDKVVDCDGLQVMVDPESWPWLQGVQVDFKETLMGSGFSIANPNAAGTCGCGTSFSKGGTSPAMVEGETCSTR